MPAASMATAEPSPVTTAAESSPVTTTEASPVTASKRFVMPIANMMVLPGMVDNETWRVASSIDRPSVRVGGVAIAWFAIVTICWSAPAQTEAE
jgi:hypothetical protein